MKSRKLIVSLIFSTIAILGFITTPVNAAECVTFITPSGYSDVSASKIFIDGAEKATIKSGDESTFSVELSDTNVKTAIMYQYDDNNIPVGMTVWQLKTETTVDENQVETTTIVPTKLDNFTDILKYFGFSVRVTGESGLRSKSGILTSAKTALISDEGLKGYDGDDATTYHMVEYGQLAMSPANFDSGNYNFVYGGDKVGIARCYYTDENGAIVDKLFAQEDGRDIFTNALTDIAPDAFDDSYYFRSYIKLSNTNESGESETTIIYGPIVGRSIYYVADKLLASPSAGSMNRKVKEYLYNARNTVDFSGKKIAFLGDSVMYGCNGAAPATQVAEAYRLPKYITSAITTRYNGIDMSNEVLVSPTSGTESQGATWSVPGICSPYNMLYFAKKLGESGGQAPEIIVIMAGLNDWGYQNQGHGEDGKTGRFGVVDSTGNLYLDSTIDTTKTYYTYNYAWDSAISYSETNASVAADPGLLNYKLDNNYSYGIFRTISYLVNKYPSAKIVICTPNQAVMNKISGSSYNNRRTFENLTGYANQQKRIANYFKTLGKNVSVIDVYHNWLQEGASNFYSMLPDGTHPGPAGYQSMGNYISGELISILEQ